MERKSEGAEAAGEKRAQKFGKPSILEKWFFLPANPLITIKTAKEMFAKICIKQAYFCKNSPKNFGGPRLFHMKQIMNEIGPPTAARPALSR